MQDRREALELRRVLKEEVVSMFYSRDATRLPHEWIMRIKHALVTLAWKYNAARMVIDYTKLCYIPAAGATTSAVQYESDMDLSCGD